MYVNMYVCVHVCVHVVCMYVCMYVCTYVRTYVCMYVCIFSWVHIAMQYVRIHPHISIHLVTFSRTFKMLSGKFKKHCYTP